MALGAIDPSASATYSSILYQTKQEIRNNLRESYHQAENKSTNNLAQFIHQCGDYMLEQSLASFANSNSYYNLAAISTAQNAVMAGIECYNLYNSHASAKHNDSYLDQIAKSYLYPSAILSSFNSMDFSNNFNAMQSFKQGISTLASIVMADQLMGMLFPEV